jgi:hypothetical protein
LIVHAHAASFLELCSIWRSGAENMPQTRPLAKSKRRFVILAGAIGERTPRSSSKCWGSFDQNGILSEAVGPAVAFVTMSPLGAAHQQP